jgi:TolB protein
MGLFPKWSPVDARIAISANDIYVVDVRRSKTLRLTRTRPVELSPTWSPDGRRIAFVGKSYDLYVMSSTGHDTKRLTHTNVCEQDPAWSPNGRWIAYTWRCRPPSFIYLLDLRTGSRTRLSTTPGDGPAWSPDGKELAFRNGDEVRVKTLADGSERVLVQRLDMIGGPSWSPDGSKLLLSAGGNHVNCEKPETTVLHLFVYDIAADDLRRLPISSCFNELEGDWERR